MYKKLIDLSKKLDFIFRNKTLRSIARKTLYKYPHVIKWENFKEKIDIELKKIPKSSKRVLIAPVVNSDQILICLHSILGMALKLKGVEVECLVCNMALPACTNAIKANIDEKKFNREGPKKFCNACFDCSHTLLYPVDKNYLKLGNYINPDDLAAAEQISESLNFEEITRYEKNGVKIGEHTLAGTLRFYGKGNLEINSYNLQTLRRYFRSALLTQIAFERILNHKKYDCVVVDHGLYVPQGILSEVANSKKINTKVIWQGHKENSLLISDKITFHKSLITESEDDWKNYNFDENKRKKILNYIAQRSGGKSDWISFNKNPNMDIDSFKKKYQVKNKVISLMTSVSWDAQLKFEHNIFKNQMEWIYFTIDHFKKKENIDLIIRVHPAEIRSDVPSAQKIKNEIFKKYNSLPENIKIIDADDPFSSYKLAEISETVLVYSTKLSFEVPAYFGKNTIVCGEAFAKNKGFTIDPKSKDEYESILHNIEKLNELSSEKTDLARRYAYHFFFRRCMKLNCLTTVKNTYPPFKLNENFVDDFLSGKEKALEIAYNSIISNQPAILDV